jgi:hypothetical protein
MKESGILDITSKLPLLKNISQKKSGARKSAFDDTQEFVVEYLDQTPGEASMEMPAEEPGDTFVEIPLEMPVEDLQPVPAEPQKAVAVQVSREIPVETPREQPDEVSESKPARFRGLRQVWDVIRILALAAFRLRSVFLAIPIIYLALRLAAYNSEHLPLLVGLDLQSTGEFAKTISRQTAVTMPLFLTGGCLALMCFSRKTLYPWLISLFSLVIPILLLVTNMYPA